jgi:predicted NBD/HSP70 family sugar kinase
VYVADGRIGATMLIDGRPNRGCMIGANELGHTRFFVETRRCFCGSVGCLECICSSEFLRIHGRNKSADLETAVANYNVDRPEAAIELLLQHLATALSNTVNFVRPHRFVIASSFVRHPAFCDALLRKIRAGILGQLLQRLHIDVWDEHEALSAETAGWLALASLFREGWVQQEEQREQTV